MGLELLKKDIELLKKDIEFLRYGAHAYLGYELHKKHGNKSDVFSYLDGLTEVTPMGGFGYVTCSYVYNGQEGWIGEDHLAIFALDYAKMKGILKEN